MLSSQISLHPSEKYCSNRAREEARLGRGCFFFIHVPLRFYWAKSKLSAGVLEEKAAKLSGRAILALIFN